MKILEYMEKYGYEQLVLCTDKDAGLKAIISIHDTTLGPACGGARMWPFASEEEAILDALRLSRAMTYKSSAAGLDLGGGKAVIIGNSEKDKSEALFRSLGRFIESLGGRYIVTEDVGLTVQDLVKIRTETDYVVGLPMEQGGSGDPSVLTGYGVYLGMKACVKEAFGTDELGQRRIAIQGAGKVASHLLTHLKKEEAEIVVADINEEAAARVKKEFGVEVTDPASIYDVDCDIFAPCALGGVLSSDTIPRLKCRIVCGGANNQLLEESHALELQEAGILYAPDFIVNAGGIINVSFELTGYDENLARAKTSEIYNTVEKVIATAKRENITTAEAANRLAEERLQRVRQLKASMSR